jgi:hypothetical protein
MGHGIWDMVGDKNVDIDMDVEVGIGLYLLLNTWTLVLILPGRRMDGHPPPQVDGLLLSASLGLHLSSLMHCFLVLCLVGI